MHDFPGNSQKVRARAQTPQPPPPEDRPKVERITTSQAEQRKPGLGRRLKETFIGASARDTAEYMVVETIVPGIRDMLFDAFEGGLHRMIYGDSQRTRRNYGSTYSNVGHVNYQGMSTKPSAAQQPSGRMLSRRSRSSHDFGEIILDDRREAADVLEQMFEYLSRFGEVKVADLYTMTGIRTEHTDHKYGWTALPGAKLIRTRDNRFLLDLPEPIALD